MSTETETTPDRHAEAKLMNRVAARDQQAFAELTEKYSALIFSTAFKVLNHYEDTEDIMNEVLATIWKKADTYHPKKGSLVTWICTTTRNRAIDRVRSVQRRCALYDRFEEKVEGDAPEYSLTGREALYLSDARTILQSAVVALSPEQREVIELAYFEGLTQQQIADQLGEPLGTVKARIRRGLAKFRQTIGEE
jgi:RNA polymerase sigma-70 factor (ECF subfamily)